MKNVILIALVTITALIACSKKKESSAGASEFFSVKVDGVLWEAFPDEEFKEYNVSHSAIDGQFSIFAVAKDGSTMDLSFHSIDKIGVGNYPATENDNGTHSGVFYNPEVGGKSSDKYMSATTSEVPIQQNVVQISKIDKSDPKAYIIEGTFSPTLYAAYATNPKRTSKLTEGKFRVIYHAGGTNDPPF
ncbi:hypothetical protein SAMN04487898_12437 [Pedobacter sp. ok626]|uniref:hypothetical protein n=1 Tax=Pedobacter sp. ok626 TaxID=1761882 RepID=UPI00088CDEB2|nr:hypothetical protein [Pedobacter sp. ok626]SDL75638.1 hypothetical protein SAMN04487898_12437 [Pedobacter sp. ok626]